MPPTRVGTLDHPERFDGARSVSVYENAGGSLFIKFDGLREKLHGSCRWTTTSGIQMRGRSRYTEPRPPPGVGGPDSDDDSDENDDQEAEEQRQIDLAIERSLQQDVGPPVAIEDAGQAPEVEAAGDDATDGDAPASGSRNCVICLEENAACMVCQPCFHMVSCQACSRHLQGRPCPMCRRNVTRVTRVYF